MPAPKQPNAYLSPREMGTVLAALILWREEMCPHGRPIMRPYFEAAGVGHLTPLSAAEIDRLSQRLQTP